MTQKSEELVQRLKGELALSDPNWRLGPLFGDLITRIEALERDRDDSTSIITEQQFVIDQLQADKEELIEALYRWNIAYPFAPECKAAYDKAKLIILKHEGKDAYTEILDRPGFKAVAEQYDGEEK